ncbi:MAG: hypothetical protein OEY15_02470 [Myxococcales bacterium]|nr:hypothetical protein [Myxococcales bacterium]
MRARTRVLLMLEFLIGALPAIVFYVYHFPVGVFWVRRVLELARDGTTNPFTTSIALIFVAGGVGVLSLCALFLARLAGGGWPGRALLAGLLVGLAAALGLLIVSGYAGGYWTDYCMFGMPILVGAHLLCSGMRHGAQRRNAAHPLLR